jgi:hypothetical protein
VIGYVSRFNMLTVRLMGSPELTPNMRQAAIGRFLAVLQVEFGGLENAIQTHAEFERLCKKYRPNPVPSEESAPVDRWEKTYALAKAAAFRPWPDLGHLAHFDLSFKPDGLG